MENVNQSQEEKIEKSNYKDIFVDEILRLHYTAQPPKGDSKYMMCPCPVCDGSDTRTRDHLHILISDNAPLVYGCFRATCGIKGVVNKTFARKLGIRNSELLDILSDESNVKGSRMYKATYFNNGKLRIPDKVDDECSVYFYKRTGKSLTYEIQKKFNIFTNLAEFAELNKNNIDYYKVNKYVFHHKKRKYLYFLNETGTSLIYRSIDNKHEFSKGRINLVEPQDKFREHKPYGFRITKSKPKNRLKKTQPTLFIAEGPFDILNTYFVDNEEINGTYISSAGNVRMISIIREYIKYNRNSAIYIYADNDVPPTVYKKKLSKFLKDRVDEVYLVYNTLSKDIGDIQKPIKLKKKILYKKKKLIGGN